MPTLLRTALRSTPRGCSWAAVRGGEPEDGGAKDVPERDEVVSATEMILEDRRSER
jgi:hypothetical protein